jgi:hypothetical protein
MTASILTVLLLLAPVVPESARFTIRQNGQTIGTEEFSIRARDKGYLAEARTQLTGDPTTLTSRMELDENLIPTFYEYTRGAGTIRVKVDSKSSELTVLENGEASSTDFRYPGSASIIDNNFFHHFLLLLYRVKGTSEQTFQIFVPQDMRVGQARVRPTSSRTFGLELGEVKLEATVDAQGRLLRLAVPGANVVVER